MSRQLRIIALLLLVTGVGTTWLFWTHEHGANPRIHGFSDVLWWWFVSSTTVGYGDIAPITGMGRIAGVITIIVGIYCYTNFIAITADAIHGMTNQRRNGTAKISARDHVVICEYTAFADELIQGLSRYPELARREIVIVTDLVQVQPYPQHSFVRGVPLSPAALAQANIREAAYVFVFANVRYHDPDLKTLHIVSRIRKENSTAHIFVELLDPDSPLLAHLGGKLTVLASKEMLESILKHQGVDLAGHLEASSPA